METKAALFNLYRVKVGDIISAKFLIQKDGELEFLEVFEYQKREKIDIYGTIVQENMGFSVWALDTRYGLELKNY
jgi:hypothetical protein